jgi:hypothetical protein
VVLQKGKNMEEKELAGSCLCGAVHYAVHGPWLRFMHCHCSRCRKATGTGHASNLFTTAGNFHWTQGEDQVRRFELPTAARFTSTFCTNCGARLPSVSRDGTTVNIPAGSLDDVPDAMPQARIYFGSRMPWSCEDSLPKFEDSARG